MRSHKGSQPARHLPLSCYNAKLPSANLAMRFSTTYTLQLQMAFSISQMLRTMRVRKDNPSARHIILSSEGIVKPCHAEL